MGESIIRVTDFSGGANTTANGVTSKPHWAIFDEANVDGGGSRRRLGKVKIAQFTAYSTIVDFDGTNDILTIPADSRVIPLGTRWTFKILFQTDSIASNRYIMGRTGAGAVSFKIMHSTSSTVVVTVTDSASNATTLTWTGVAAATVCALQVARDGATLTGYLNGVVQATTMHATNLLIGGAQQLGADNGGSLFDGGIDFLRLLSTYETSQRDGWCRSMFPRNQNTLADWIVTLDANGYALDRGIYEMHMTSAGSPATDRTALAYNADPVVSLSNNIDSSGRLQGYAIVGDRVVPYRP